MRHEDAGLALWVASDQSARERSSGCEELELAAAANAVTADAGRSVRQRAGRAVIALGERLAGEHRPAPQRRLAGQRS